MRGACSECSRHVYAKGLCKNHYEHQKKYGSPTAIKMCTCAWCGVEFEWASNGKGRPSVTCSPKCKKLFIADRRRKKHLAKHSSPMRKAICTICGAEFEHPHKPGQPPKLCSGRCKAERARRQARKWFEDNPDRVAEQLSRNPEYRSKKFREWYEANKERESKRSVEYQRMNPKDKAARDAKYRALKRGSVGAEKFTLDEIFERDEQICYLCNEKVNRKDATMDHVIPITKGGPHTRANVKLAHRGCNARKSDKILTA